LKLDKSSKAVIHEKWAGRAMCYLIGKALQSALTRRNMLGGGMAAASFMCAPVRAATDIQRELEMAQATVPADQPGSRLLLLGTAGGPAWWPNTDRCSFSSAVIVGDATYLVDCGEGVGKRLQQSLSPIGLGALKTLRALFVTHLHSDHTVDYPNILLYGLYNGLDRPSPPLKVFGPGRRGQMEPVFSLPGRTAVEPEIINPDNPTPGISDMTNYIAQAYATDLNDRMRDNGKRSLKTLVEAHDIAIPPVAGFKSANETPSQEMEPFKVFEDDRVRVSATLVDHFPIWPAFAFRFDTDEGSVVFSGDTSPNKNLIKLAKGADVLVHEVIVVDWVNRLFPEPRSTADEGLRQHLLNAHTPVDQVGKVAEAAGVAKLVLSHIVPGNATNEQLSAAKSGFSGELIIGQDLMTIPLTAAKRKG
jgi:ribonuclease BN (tRNA processing enzyme)